MLRKSRIWPPGGPPGPPPRGPPQGGSQGGSQGGPWGGQKRGSQDPPWGAPRRGGPGGVRGPGGCTFSRVFNNSPSRDRSCPRIRGFRQRAQKKAANFAPPAGGRISAPGGPRGPPRDPPKNPPFLTPPGTPLGPPLGGPQDPPWDPPRGPQNDPPGGPPGPPRTPPVPVPSRTVPLGHAQALPWSPSLRFPLLPYRPVAPSTA